MTRRRIVLFAAAIAILPGIAWWLLTLVVTDAEEGANIGMGVLGLGVIAVSWVVAAVFVLARARRRTADRQRT